MNSRSLEPRLIGGETDCQQPSDGWRNGIACGLVVTAVLLMAHPVAEMGFIDDFSYIKTAQILAATGHLVYNGWATAMLGWLMPWGALFIKLFGFSFTTVRSSMLPIAVVVVVLFHASLRRFAIPPQSAVIGALTLGLSPLFLPMVASYMTDVPGLAVIVSTLYLCQRALGSRTSKSAMLWLGAAAFTNVLGGTVRQISWLGALVMLPVAGWLLRKSPGVKFASIVLWIGSVFAVLFCMHWFASQPYALEEKLVQGPIHLSMLAHLGVELLKSFLCLSLVLLPLSIAWLVPARNMTRRARLRIIIVITGLGLLSLVLARTGGLEHRVMPWLGHVIGTLSIFPSTGEMLGSRPVTITMPIRVLLSLVVVAVTLVLLEHLRTVPWTREKSSTSPMLQCRWLVGPFSAAYIAFLLPRAAYSFIYDRYLLGLLPGAIVFLLLLHQRWIAPRLPATSILVLLLYTIYTTAATHDWFALNRARVRAVAEVHDSGVPFTSIQGGFDYDGWTQIEAAGYINDARIRNPAGVYKFPPTPNSLSAACRLPFAEFTPAISPRFFITFHRMNCLRNSSFNPVTYGTWLPPFRREIYVQRAP